MEKQSKTASQFKISCCDVTLNSLSMLMAAQGRMQHSPSFQFFESFETGQQCPHTVVLAVASAACGLLSESRTSDNWISSSQHSSVPQHQPVLR